MTEDRNRHVEKGKPANDDDVVIYTIPEHGGRISIEAHLTIGGRRAELFLSEWLDGDTQDAESAARTALRRVALSFLEALRPEPG